MFVPLTIDRMMQRIETICVVAKMIPVLVGNKVKILKFR